jgi:hypothetical protein
MVTINHHAKVNIFAMQRWHVRRDGLYHITIELRPVILWKGRMVNVRISRVKDES